VGSRIRNGLFVRKRNRSWILEPNMLVGSCDSPSSYRGTSLFVSSSRGETCSSGTVRAACIRPNGPSEKSQVAEHRAGRRRQARRPTAARGVAGARISHGGVFFSFFLWPFLGRGPWPPQGTCTDDHENLSLARGFQDNSRCAQVRGDAVVEPNGPMGAVAMDPRERNHAAGVGS
jgi:hypothetical protein